MKRATFDPRNLPGAVSIEEAEKALTLEPPPMDEYESGLIYGHCPVCDQRLRIKFLNPDYVDLFCEGGCSPQAVVEEVRLRQDDPE